MPMRRELAIGLVGLTAACAPAPPPRVADSPTRVVPPMPASPPAAKPAPPGPAVLRFPPGAAAPRHGCFAWSASFETYACVLGHDEREPDGRSLSVTFAGRQSQRGFPLGHGLLNDATRRDLDDRMVAGGYVATEVGPWTRSGEYADVGKHRVFLDKETVRVEHDGTKIYERTDRHIPKFTPSCQLRALPAGAGRIVIERSCKVLDEGVEVTELDVWSCDDKHC